MHVVTLAVFAAQYVINRIRLVPNVIYARLSPLSFPPMFSDTIASPSVATSNVVLTEYMNFWSSGGLRGVQRWLSVFFLMKQRFPFFYLFTDWVMFRAAIFSVIPRSTQLNEWLIPTILPPAPGTDGCHFTLLSYQEYITHFNLTPGEFIIHIVQIVIFGFVVNRKNIHLLRLGNYMQAYMMQRLGQGEIDAILRGQRRATSVFPLTDKGRPASSHDLLNIGRSITPFLRRRQRFPQAKLPVQVQQTIQSIHSLGSMAPEVKQLAALNAFDTFDSKYIQYLQRRLPTGTDPLGYQAFMDVTRPPGGQMRQLALQPPRAGQDIVIANINRRRRRGVAPPAGGPPYIPGARPGDVVNVPPRRYVRRRRNSQPGAPRRRQNVYPGPAGVRYQRFEDLP